MLDGMNLIALPIAHTATRRAVEGAHAGDRMRPGPAHAGARRRDRDREDATRGAAPLRRRRRGTS